MGLEPKVFTIIINWNQHKDTIECITSVKNLDYHNFEILVVDNASREGSVKSIRDRFSDIGILENRENLGYAGGNNAGIRLALAKGADYVLILNSDVVLDRDALRQLVKAAEENARSSILAPKVYYYDKQDVINSLGTTINWFRLRPDLGSCGQKDDGRFREIESKDVLVGCALLISKATFEKIGFFDESFFAFHEDADLCLRNIRYGGKNLTVPEAIAYHKTSGTVKNCQPLVNYYNIRNFLYLADKNASFADRIRVRLGLQYLVLKNAFNLLSGDSARRALVMAFFYGVADYFTGKTGRPKRAI